jgi:heme exporter protein D
MSLDIWMRENPLTYVWLGSYAVAFLVFAIEITLVVRKRRVTLQEVRQMIEVEENE